MLRGPARSNVRPRAGVKDSTPTENAGTAAPRSSTTAPSIAPPAFSLSVMRRPSTTGAASLGADSDCSASASQPMADAGSWKTPSSLLSARASAGCSSHATTRARVGLPSASSTTPSMGAAATSLTRTTSSTWSSRAPSTARAVRYPRATATSDVASCGTVGMRKAPVSSLVAAGTIHGTPSTESTAPATGWSSASTTAPRTAPAAESTRVISVVPPSVLWSTALVTTPSGS